MFWKKGEGGNLCLHYQGLRKERGLREKDFKHINSGILQFDYENKNRTHAHIELCNSYEKRCNEPY